MTVTIRPERPVDAPAREAPLDVAYGDQRHTKPSATLRNGRKPAEGLSLVAFEHGRMLGTVRLWPVQAGRGIGAALMQRALTVAAERGHGAVLLVGDTAYYGRFGFSAAKTGALMIKGADPARLLAVELKAGALDGAHGIVTASGERLRKPRLGALAPFKARPRLVPRAA